MNSCVPSNQKEILQSTSYELATVFNLSLAILSFLFTTIAIIKLLSQSIIQFSTKIFLISSLFYVFVQDCSYSAVKINMIWDLLFRMNQTCYPYYKISDCYFILKGVIMAQCGLMLNQTFMSLDRVFQLIFPKFHSKYMMVFTMSSLIFTFIVSFFTFEILTIGDPLEGQLLICAYFPPKSSENFNIFITIIFYLSIAHFIIGLVILKFVNKKKTQVNISFNMLEKYHAKESLKSIQYAVLISTVQFTAQLLSSFSIKIFLSIGGTFLSSSYYAMISSLTYSLQYFCLVHPILIIWMLRKTRVERQRSIEKMRSQKNSHEEHIARMNHVWA